MKAGGKAGTLSHRLGGKSFGPSRRDVETFAKRRLMRAMVDREADPIAQTSNRDLAVAASGVDPLFGRERV